MATDMLVLGLTGSIGMGKSTTAQMFRDEGVPVYDADAAVHQLYEREAVDAIEAAFPGTTADGRVDRKRLGERVIDHPEAFARLEAIIHPMAAGRQRAFLQRAQADGEDVVVLDIPLLFETGGDARVDAIIVVTADREVQHRRVLERPGMTEQKLEAILARQTPDSQKRQKADFLIDTGKGMDHARQEVRKIIQWARKTAVSTGNGDDH